MLTFTGKTSKTSSTEALDMNTVGHKKPPQPSTSVSASSTQPSIPMGTDPPNLSSHATANGNTQQHRKKSILKKSETSIHKTKDPELENLLVSDPESVTNTPALPRKATHGVDLPPTANHDQLKSLTGPKLRVGTLKGAPTGNAGSNHGQNNVVAKTKTTGTCTKNNGSVASKEIQTSTISLLALATAAAQAANNNKASDKYYDSSDKAMGVTEHLLGGHHGQPLTLIGGQTPTPNNVFKCPNDMCRHNKVSSAMSSSPAANKRKICLCGRTMVNTSLLQNYTSVVSRSGDEKGSIDTNDNKNGNAAGSSEVTVTTAENVTLNKTDQISSS